MGKRSKEISMDLHGMIKSAIKNAGSYDHKDYFVDEEHMGKYCDHTVLRAYTPKKIVEAFCKEAIENGAAAMCINPVHTSFVRKMLEGTTLKTCVVIGFPLGATTPAVKAFEAAEAVSNGAQELDMVINVGALIDGDYEFVYNDIKGVVDAATEKACVKVIIETCYLSNEQKIAACVLAKAAGAKYVKTSSGFGTWGATEEDVRLIKAVIGDDMHVKASTGIETRSDAIKMVKAGAERLGASRIVQIVSGDNSAPSVSKMNQPRKREE
jgi:deoxyribose-phosphate aldolase